MRPGRYLLRVILADETGKAGPAGGPAASGRWQLEQEVVIGSGQALLVEFSEDTGLIRRATHDHELPGQFSPPRG